MVDENNYMLVSLDDEKSKNIAEIVSSKTSRKIINYLAGKEASQKDLSDALNVPLNTIEYNIKKLLSSGFIEKAKNFFWSKKGKKIVMYKLSNKSIIISPKKSSLDKIKSILPAFILTIAGTIAIAVYEKIKTGPQLMKTEEVLYSASEIARDSSMSNLISVPFPLWGWFLAGALLAITIISIINWRKL